MGETAADRQAEEVKAEEVKAEEVKAEDPRAAFRGLMERELDYGYRLANAILGDPVESEDAVHDAVIRAWQKWAGLRDRSRFGPWFRAIIVNTCRDRLRRASRLEMADISAQSALTTPDPTGRVADRVVVEQALGRLGPDDRVVLALRFAHDLKLEDAARLLDIPTATFKSRLRTALKRLRSTLEDIEPEGIER